MRWNKPEWKPHTSCDKPGFRLYGWNVHSASRASKLAGSAIKNPASTIFGSALAVHKLPGVDRDNLGAALLERSGGGAAYAYYRDIEVFAQDSRCEAGLVLAAVIAHEIGHGSRA